MREFAVEIEEQNKKDIAHVTNLLQPFMANYQPHDSDAFCERATLMLPPKEAAELLMSTSKH
jgi:hypothetical protein